MESFGFDTGLFTWSGAALVATATELKNVTASWDTAPKVVLGLTVAAATGSLATGVMTAGYRLIPVSRRGRLSPVCARLSAVLSTPAFIVATGCSLGGHVGCVAGVTSAAVVASITTALWAFEGRSAGEAVSNFWRRLPSVSDFWRRLPGVSDEPEPVPPLQIVGGTAATDTWAATTPGRPLVSGCPAGGSAVEEPGAAEGVELHSIAIQ